jgi:hypothetical protein
LDLAKVVSDLKRERVKLSRVIGALLGSALTSVGKKRGGLTPAGRKRLSLAMKKRWAERKKIEK